MPSKKWYWVREGTLEDGTWHIVDKEYFPRDVFAYGKAACGDMVPRLNFSYDNKDGWEWIRQHEAKICVPCMDALPKITDLTITWNAKGIFVAAATD